jgi:large subunit ribosomal protein L13
MKLTVTGMSLMRKGSRWGAWPVKLPAGDYVIVVNADKVAVTGNKATDKMYYRHTGYIGNLKSASFAKMQETAPGRVIEIAVKGMLPKNPLGRAMYRKLKVYSGPEHKHEAQQPRPLDF